MLPVASRSSLGILLAMSVLGLYADAGPGHGQQAALSGTGAISGALVSAADGAPVRNATVQASCEFATSSTVVSRAVRTDENGRFAFEGLPACSYKLSAFQQPFLRSVYGQRRPGTGLGKLLVLADGRRLTDIRFPIAIGGAISGRVQTPSRDAVAGVRVEGLALVEVGKRVELRFAAEAVSNDRGEYRLFGLNPGRYVIRVTEPEQPHQSPAPRLAQAGMQVNDCPISPTRSPTYYPSAPRFSTAVPVDLDLSAELFGLDVTVFRGPLTPVRGRLVGLDQLPPTTRAVLADGFVCQAVGSIEADGRFSFGSVPPGPYRVDVRTPTGSGGFWASVEVGISSTAEGIVVPMQPGVRVAGRARTDAGPWNPKLLRPDEPIELVLNIRLGAGAEMYSARTTIGQAGSFEILGVAPGHYEIWGTSTESMGGIVNAVFNGTDSVDFGLDVGSGGVAGLDLVYSAKVHKLVGRIAPSTNNSDSPCYAVVFAKDSAYWMPGSRRVNVATPDGNGEFVFQFLPPGDYWIAAYAETGKETRIWPDPSALNALRSVSSEVHMTPGSTQQANLTCR